MTLYSGSRSLGVRLAAISLTTGALAFGQAATAQTLFTINGVDVDTAVVDIYYESALRQTGGQATPEQREQLMTQLRDIYILGTQDKAAELAETPEVAAQIELQRISILAQAVANDFYDSVEVTEEELLAEYGRQIEAAPDQQFKARHILVQTQSEAIEIIGQLNDGADFQELAREKSIGPSGPNGGDLGWFSPNQMVAPFSQAVATMEDGAYSSEPVQTQFGWHVILREESREQTPPTFESVRENVTAAVQQAKFQEYLESLRQAGQ
jgi:peptidyl-prolyl cis-trans isomerase C